MREKSPWGLTQVVKGWRGFVGGSRFKSQCGQNLPITIYIYMRENGIPIPSFPFQTNQLQLCGFCFLLFYFLFFLSKLTSLFFLSNSLPFSLWVMETSPFMGSNSTLLRKKKIVKILFILINDDEYLHTNTFEFYNNSNSISYSNSN